MERQMSEEQKVKSPINDLEKQIASGAEELDVIFKGVAPWAVEYESSKKLFEDYALKDKAKIEQYLGAFYLFKVSEISISEEEEEKVADRIYKRHSALITASYQSGYTVATIIVGKGGGYVDLYIGVKGEDEKNSEIFSSLIKGVFPGKGFAQKEEKPDERIIQKRLSNMNYGGIVTGVPTIKIDDEKQIFDISSVVRSLNDKDFVLAFISKPVARATAAAKIKKLMEIKDKCHILTKRTVGVEENSGINGTITKQIVNENEAITKSRSLTGFGALSLTGTGTVSLIAAPFGVGASVALSVSIGSTFGAAITAGGSKTSTKGNNENETKGWSKNVGQSLTYEEQSSLAMEMENIAGKLIKRIRTGLNNGLWESYISFATVDETTSRILTGALCGELIKGDPEALPVKTFSAELIKEVPFFIPKDLECGKENIFGNLLCSNVTSDELGVLMALPVNSVPGFDIKIKPKLSLTDVTEDGFNIATICEHGKAIKDLSFQISESDIRKHIFVAGLTGSGKTTTVKEIISKADKPFLVIESAKREYRRLISEKKFSEKLKVYTVGDAGLCPIRHNPFWVMPKVSVVTHIDNLKSIFNASFSLYGPMPYILEKCLANIYKTKGWSLTTGEHNNIKIENIEDSKNNKYVYPSLKDLKDEINRYVKEEMEYKGELQDNIRTAIIARIDSLSVGAKGFLFNTYEFMDIEKLLKELAVFELESLVDDDDKAFFVGLILALISEYRQGKSRNSSLNTDNDELKHILVIEEAHRLLKNVQTERTSEMMGNPKGKAVEAFCNIIAEMRSMGQGIIVAEQIPTKIAPDVIKNTNTKIIHRMVSYDEQVAVGAGLGLSDQESRYLSQLSTGFAIAHKEGMAKPVEISVNNTLLNNPIDDIRIKKLGKELFENKLQEQILLHDSGLMDNDHVFSISLRMLNSLFLSEKSLKELIEVATKKIEVLFEFPPSKEAITMALKEQAYRILFSKTYSISNKRIEEPLKESYERMWSEKGFSEKRFFHSLNEWSGSDVKAIVLDRIEKLVIREHLKNKIDAEKLALSMFLVDDINSKRMLSERINKGVL
jgi:hypothetical protein